MWGYILPLCLFHPPPTSSPQPIQTQRREHLRKLLSANQGLRSRLYFHRGFDVLNIMGPQIHLAETVDLLEKQRKDNAKKRKREAKRNRKLQKRQLRVEIVVKEHEEQLVRRRTRQLLWRSFLVRVPTAFETSRSKLINVRKPQRRLISAPSNGSLSKICTTPSETRGQIRRSRTQYDRSMIYPYTAAQIDSWKSQLSYHHGFFCKCKA